MPATELVIFRPSIHQIPAFSRRDDAGDDIGRPVNRRVAGLVRALASRYPPGHRSRMHRRAGRNER